MNGGWTYRLEVTGANVPGRTLLDLLADTYTHSDRATWTTRFDAGELETERRGAMSRAAARDPATPGTVVFWHRPPWNEPDVPLHYATVFEDAHVLAVDKPSGLPTAPAGGFLAHTLTTLVQRDRPGATYVHRLGRGTSGLVLFAKSDVARTVLAADFREHRLTKTYRALASGRIDTTHDVRVPIGELPHPLLGRLHAASENGKPAHSQVIPLELRDDATLCDVTITTGRPHQIRIHLAAIGHPLVGDPLYGPGGSALPGLDALPGDLGYHLHAHRLALAHPVTGAALDLVAPPPAPLRLADGT